MSAHHQDHTPTDHCESHFERHARRTLRAAIVYYGWDHPVVSGAQRSLAAIRQVG